MSTPHDVVIIGGGLAGAKTAEALREQGFEGTVTLLAAEDRLPYERPPLSKDYLSGGSTFDEALVHDEDWYRDQHVDLRLGTRATSVDTVGRQVRLADGTSIAYDKLVLATGSTPRELTSTGAPAGGLHYLRTKEDADALKPLFGAGKRVAIIGGGWIGLEVAATARAAGTEVTVLEESTLPLLKVLGPGMAEVFAALHRDHGVDLRTTAHVEQILRQGTEPTGVLLGGGDTVDADAIIVGIGATPDVRLAEEAGLAVDDGVLVDASLRTSDPDVYAVGDIAHADHPTLGRRIRVEHWAAALNQPAVAAASLLGGNDVYDELPYFFSDQFGLGMECVGFAPQGSYDRVVTRGDVAGREFVAFWLDAENHILQAMNVNVWDVVDEVKPLIAERRVVDPEKLADPSVAYSDL